MTRPRPARTTYRPARIRRIRAAGLLVVVAAIGTALAYQLPASSSSAVSALSTDTRPVGAPPDELPDTGGDRRGPLGEADGAVPDGTTLFDDWVRGVANLDPTLRGALRRAATDAELDGVTFFVDSGWRSPAYQQELLRQAILKYGSKEEAARWVAGPKTSAHVSGEAVDIGRSDAAAWLSDHGAAYGLCQIYRNEPWHYELRPQAVAQGCPPTYADPTQDPRTQP